jgi:peptidoglycan/xylan/chitin deacetylase (PgdA/CDA1 family)
MFAMLAGFLFPSLIWKMKGDEKSLYLTFDDGPIPNVTPWVLDVLKHFNASATFFCVGQNARKYPELIHRIKEEGHALGNHSMNHLNGWKTRNESYCNDVIEGRQFIDSSLFRPPYGKIKPSQIRALKKDFRIIMWDVLSKDYDSSLKGEKCFEIIKKKTGNGSIIVFHDSIKAEDRLRYSLPETLKYFSELGFSFKSISVL